MTFQHKSNYASYEDTRSEASWISVGSLNEINQKEITTNNKQSRRKENEAKEQKIKKDGEVDNAPISLPPTSLPLFTLHIFCVLEMTMPRSSKCGIPNILVRITAPS